jgi:hypothetical protein
MGIPKLIVFLAGVRGAKSLMCAAAAMRSSMLCDTRGFMPGEVPRVPIVSIHKDLAAPTINHLMGAVTNQPALRRMLAGEPTGDSVMLRHPTGRSVEVRVVAGARAGASLVARWLAGCVFDEAPRMIGSQDGVVNLDDMLRSIAGRMLGPIWLIGSPWAPFGPVFDIVKAHQGHPSEECVVIRAPGPWLNPTWWTPERMAELQRTDPTAYRTDVEAEFADPAEALIPSATIDACTRSGPAILPPEDGHSYGAAMDPGTRSNAWTLCVGTRRAGRCLVAMVKQWQGTPTRPLDPDAVLGEIALLLRGYRLDSVDSDGWSGDALLALARRNGLRMKPSPDAGAAR